MGNDDFDPDEIYIVAEEWDIDLNNINTQTDMHGYPVYTEVLKVQEELKEQQLRNEHPELKEAYENYAKLLAKYGFWDKITK
jgi:hypothetical protein